MPQTAPEHESLPVMVPRNVKRLAPIMPDRVKRLEEHLRDCLGDLARATRAERLERPLPPAPEGFAGLVAKTACSLCRGHCCRNGEDAGFLDARALARTGRQNPAHSDQAIIRLYLERVPSDAYQGSCIFHGKKGCTLDRMMRSDVCNTYFCRGLGEYLRSRAAREPTIVIAGGSEKPWVSPVLKP